MYCMSNSELCATTVSVIPQEDKVIFEYKKLARKECSLVGGITETNFCPNQKYLKTIKTRFRNLDVCTEIYQCVGFSWKCSRSNGGYIE